MKRLMITGLLICTAALVYSQPALSAREQQATDLYKAGKATEAIAAFKAAYNENPKSLYTINALGNLYYGNRQYQDALNIADEGIKLSGSAPNFVVVKAKAEIMTNKAKEAAALIDQYLANHQVDFMMLFVKATAFNALGDRQQALNFFSQSISANPDYPPAYLARGKDFAGIERWSQALKDYDKYITMVDDDYNAYVDRGLAYQLSHDLDKAIADYTKALQLNPKQINALNNRAVAYRDMKQMEKATNDFNTAIALNPNFADPYFEMAMLYKDNKEYTKGLPFITKAIALQPDRAMFYSLQSLLFLSLDRNNEGLAAAGKVIALDPKNPDGYLDQGTAYHNLEKYDDALKSINTGITVAPDNYLLYSLRAVIYRAKGNAQLAAADDEKAKQMAAAIR